MCVYMRADSNLRVVTINKETLRIVCIVEFHNSSRSAAPLPRAPAQPTDIFVPFFFFVCTCYNSQYYLQFYCQLCMFALLYTNPLKRLYFIICQRQRCTHTYIICFATANTQRRGVCVYFMYVRECVLHTLLNTCVLTMNRSRALIRSIRQHNAQFAALVSHLLQVNTRIKAHTPHYTAVFWQMGDKAKQRDKCT